MTKGVAAILVFVGLLAFSLTLPKEKEYREIHYKTVAPISTEDYQITFSDMHSQEDFVMMRAEVRNLTNDFLALERSKIAYTIDGNSQNLRPKKWLIKPFGKKRLTLKSAPQPGLPAEKVSVKFDGLSKVPVKGRLPDLEAYPLPDTKKVISNDEVQLKLTRLLKKTKVTECTFELTNIGKHALLLDQTRMTATAEGDDNQWPTEGESKGYRVLWPGDDYDFFLRFTIPGKVVDMQFANMLVHWNEGLLISELEDYPSSEFELEMDLGKTEARN